MYGSMALALHRHWDLGKVAILRLFDVSREVWRQCAADDMHSMIELCEKETGIEVQNGNGKSWQDLPYLNATLDAGKMSNAQWVYMRQRQKDWIAPQIMACLLVALHRKYGFGYERCARVYQQVQEIEASCNMSPRKVNDACINEVKIRVEDVFMMKGGKAPA